MRTIKAEQLQKELEEAMGGNYKVTMIADYSKDYYIFEAVPKINKGSIFTDCTYGLEKKTGRITRYSPSADIEKFIEATTSRRVI